MSSPDLTPILEDLAAGRIDAAEASRRIDAQKARRATSQTPSNAQTSAGPEPSRGDLGSDALSDLSDDSAPGTEEPGEPKGEEWKGEESKGEPRWQAYARETFNRVAGYAAGDQQPRPQPQPGAEPFRTPAGADDEVPAASRETTNTKGVDRVSVRAVGRRVRIASEPRVTTASVDGAHVLRRTGSVLEISSDGELGASIDGFTLLRPPRSLEASAIWGWARSCSSVSTPISLSTWS